MDESFIIILMRLDNWEWIKMHMHCTLSFTSNNKSPTLISILTRLSTSNCSLLNLIFYATSIPAIEALLKTLTLTKPLNHNKDAKN